MDPIVWMFAIPISLIFWALGVGSVLLVAREIWLFFERRNRLKNHR